MNKEIPKKNKLFELAANQVTKETKSRFKLLPGRP